MPRPKPSGWRQGLSILGQAAGYSVGTSFIYGVWRERELAAIRIDAIALVKSGYVIIDSPVSPAQKRAAWDVLKPVLMAHWTKAFGSEGSDTWPQPASGKLYSASSTNNKVNGLPRLTTDNYRLQSLCVYLVDPLLEGRVHFGTQTHFRLALLMGPFAFFGGVAGGVGKTVLQGSDQSWHLANLVNKHGRAGEAIPWAGHIDGGENNAFQVGRVPTVVPPSPSPHPSQSPEDGLLLTLLHQLCILFHCETPGDLQPVHGPTGFYLQSHLPLLLAWRMIPGGIPWGAHVGAIRQLCQQECAPSLTQPPLPETKQVVVFGLTAHTTMWAVKGMGLDANEVRVIQNAKVKASSEVRQSHDKQRAFIDAIPHDALVRVLARGNREEWKTVLGLTDAEVDRAEVLAKTYLAHAAASPAK